MIIGVNNGEKPPIEGIAHAAGFSIRGDEATIAVATGDLIASPRPGHEFDLSGGRWAVVRTTSRTRHVLTFTARRLANAR